MKDYLIEVKTKKDIGSLATVRGFLSEWRRSDERLRPEMFDLGEPIRRRFEREGIESAVSLWIENGIALMFKRVRKPKFVVDIDWRQEKGLDPRPFPWGCTVWLHGSAGDRLAVEFLRFLIRHFEPVFGSISTDEDDRNKHFISFNDLSGRSERYIGRDIGETLPGVYWTTYFGPWAVEKIGEERFAELKGENVESIYGGFLVQAYKSASEAGSPVAEEAETRIANQLGRQHFFNKATVDIEALKTRPQDAAIVEEKIKELKATKKRPK
jgi:hypothetical protein